MPSQIFHGIPFARVRHAVFNDVEHGHALCALQEVQREGERPGSFRGAVPGDGRPTAQSQRSMARRDEDRPAAVTDEALQQRRNGGTAFGRRCAGNHQIMDAGPASRILMQFSQPFDEAGREADVGTRPPTLRCREARCHGPEQGVRPLLPLLALRLDNVEQLGCAEPRQPLGNLIARWRRLGFDTEHLDVCVESPTHVERGLQHDLVLRARFIGIVLAADRRQDRSNRHSRETTLLGRGSKRRRQPPVTVT